MIDFKEIVQDLHFEQQLTIEDMPKVDLYMDQVIQLFETTYKQATRNPAEKVLTKTMINNYAKGKLLFPIQKKKYSSEHIMLINFIYQLKGGLSIQDIKIALANFNHNFTTDESFSIEDIYELYLSIQKENAACFEEALLAKHELVKNKIQSLQPINDTHTEAFLMLASAIQMSNMYRKVAEKIIDDLNDNEI